MPLWQVVSFVYVFHPDVAPIVMLNLLHSNREISDHSLLLPTTQIYSCLGTGFVGIDTTVL